MKEFDLEKAKAGAPVCTRDGRQARIICWDYQEYGTEKDEDKFPIIALVKYDRGERAYTYRENGKCHIHKKDELMMADVKHEGWVNLYRSKNSITETSSIIWDSEALAKNESKDDEDYVTTVKIEWEE